MRHKHCLHEIQYEMMNLRHGGKNKKKNYRKNKFRGGIMQLNSRLSAHTHTHTHTHTRTMHISLVSCLLSCNGIVIELPTTLSETTRGVVQEYFLSRFHI